jgi:hypothetical protein
MERGRGMSFFDGSHVVRERDVLAERVRVLEASLRRAGSQGGETVKPCPNATHCYNCREADALAERVRELRDKRGEYWQVQRCLSCDDHGGHGREWSIWAGGAQGVRVAHGLHQHEALTIAKHVNTLREVMDDAAAQAPLSDAPRERSHPGGERTGGVA